MSMSMDEALTWAATHGAVIRFYTNDLKQTMVRVAVDTEDPAVPQIVLCEPMPSLGMLATVITDVADEFEVADRRASFRIVS